MRCKATKAQPTLRSEGRGQTRLHYAEPRGGKACEAGLKRKAENGKLFLTKALEALGSLEALVGLEKLGKLERLGKYGKIGI